MDITLTPDIEAALTEEARRQGVSPESLALESLRQRFVRRVPKERPGEGEESLADFLAGHIGVLDSSEHVPGGAGMSVETGKQFTEILTKRREQRR